MRVSLISRFWNRTWVLTKKEELTVTQRGIDGGMHQLTLFDHAGYEILRRRGYVPESGGCGFWWNDHVVWLRINGWTYIFWKHYLRNLKKPLNLKQNHILKMLKYWEGCKSVASYGNSIQKRTKDKSTKHKLCIAFSDHYDLWINVFKFTCCWTPQQLILRI